MSGFAILEKLDENKKFMLKQDDGEEVEVTEVETSDDSGEEKNIADLNWGDGVWEDDSWEEGESGDWDAKEAQPLPAPSVEPAYDDYGIAESVASDEYYSPSPYYCDPYYEYCGPSYPGEPQSRYEKQDVHKMVWSSLWQVLASTLIQNAIANAN